MPKNELSTTGTPPTVRQGVTIFKARGLKGRARADSVKSFDDILAYTENYEDLLYLKKLAKYSINRIKVTNSNEKALKIFTDDLECIDKNLKKVIESSLCNAVGLFKN